MLIFQGFANSRIVREFPPFSFKVRIATLTRNRLIGDEPVRGFESHRLRQLKLLKKMQLPESLALQGFRRFLRPKSHT